MIFSERPAFRHFHPVDTQHPGQAGGDSRAPQARHAVLTFLVPVVPYVTQILCN